MQREVFLLSPSRNHGVGCRIHASGFSIDALQRLGLSNMLAKPCPSYRASFLHLVLRSLYDTKQPSDGLGR